MKPGVLLTLIALSAAEIETSQDIVPEGPPDTLVAPLKIQTPKEDWVQSTKRAVAADAKEAENTVTNAFSKGVADFRKARDKVKAQVAAKAKKLHKEAADRMMKMANKIGDSAKSLKKDMHSAEGKIHKMNKKVLKAGKKVTVETAQEKAKQAWRNAHARSKTGVKAEHKMAKVHAKNARRDARVAKSIQHKAKKIGKKIVKVQKEASRLTSKDYKEATGDQMSVIHTALKTRQDLKNKMANHLEKVANQTMKLNDMMREQLQRAAKHIGRVVADNEDRAISKIKRVQNTIKQRYSTLRTIVNSTRTQWNAAKKKVRGHYDQLEGDLKKVDKATRWPRGRAFAKALDMPLNMSPTVKKPALVQSPATSKRVAPMHQNAEVVALEKYEKGAVLGAAKAAKKLTGEGYRTAERAAQQAEAALGPHPLAQLSLHNAEAEATMLAASSIKLPTAELVESNVESDMGDQTPSAGGTAEFGGWVKQADQPWNQYQDKINQGLHIPATTRGYQHAKAALEQTERDAEAKLDQKVKEYQHAQPDVTPPPAAIARIREKANRVGARIDTKVAHATSRNHHKVDQYQHTKLAPVAPPTLEHIRENANQFKKSINGKVTQAGSRLEATTQKYLHPRERKEESWIKNGIEQSLASLSEQDRSAQMDPYSKSILESERHQEAEQLVADSEIGSMVEQDDRMWDKQYGGANPLLKAEAESRRNMIEATNNWKHKYESDIMET